MSELQLLKNKIGYTPPLTAGDFRALPEAKEISWGDRFFDEEEDVIAVFDIDYALVKDFNTKLNYLPYLFPPAYPLLILGCHPCFLWKRVAWQAHAQHVCITRDGIRFVMDKRPSLCGLSCSDLGKVSKTVPFDKITDCDVTEPAGATCLCVQNVLTTIHVDTASSGNADPNGVIRHELTLKGLQDPYGFKKLVWAMKRSNGTTMHAAARAAGAPPGGQTMMRSGVGVSSDDYGTLPLLMSEIRDELREQTKLMRDGATKESSMLL